MVYGDAILRRAIQGLGARGLALLVALVLLAPVLLAPGLAAAASAEDSAQEKLAERSLGAADAAVTMTEFSSLTCPHCASFHTETLPRIKKEYVDSGKLRVVFHDFPLDPLALAAAMVSRCVPPDRYFGFVETLFANQQSWAASQDPLRQLQTMSRFAGLSADGFRACLNNRQLLKGVQDSAERDRLAHQINATPTFLINGRKLNGALPYETFRAAIEEALETARRGDPAVENKTADAKAASGGAKQPHGATSGAGAER